MVDVNDLKKVNDTLGHPKGDALINRVAQCLQRAAAEKGNCYRIGGDEFVVSLNGSREALLGLRRPHPGRDRGGGRGERVPRLGSAGPCLERGPA